MSSRTNRVFVIAGIAGFILTASLSFGQSEAEYTTMMKAAAAANTNMQKAVTAKDGSTAAAEAKKTETAFAEIESYWEKKGASDAVGFAKQAVSVAAAVGKSAGSGDMDAAATAAKTMAANCGGCHMAHREKTETGFKIK
jgi:hypothetical protein